jgi:DNA-binding MarR family transcriptional regulator
MNDKRETIVGQLALLYERNPYLQALIGIVQAGGVLGPLLDKRASELLKDRGRAFFDELQQGKLELTQDLIEGEEFLHCYFATTAAVLATRQRQKIRYFARLLTNGLQYDVISNVDDYEELLATLHELSYREIVALGILETYQAVNGSTEPPEGIWSRLRVDLSERLRIPPSEVTSFLSRLERSGLFRLASVAQEDDGDGFAIRFASFGGLGELTPRYFRLRKMVGEISTAYESGGDTSDTAVGG